MKFSRDPINFHYHKVVGIDALKIPFDEIGTGDIVAAREKFELSNRNHGIHRIHGIH